MSTSAFRVYNSAKKYLLTGIIDLDTSALRARLYGGTGSTGNPSTYTLSVIGGVSVQASGGGYAQKNLGTISVKQGNSAKEIRFDAADLSWSANASAIDCIKYLVLFVSGASAGAHKLIGWVHLTDTTFSLGTGNKLTVQWSSNGIFTLTGGTT
jgi:hypothetical protein